ncbi:hypothetical protein Q3G72_033086 [Acer saccharum]|nr:hypothetical protein Q3G72_033086 [Acer saccharum]
MSPIKFLPLDLGSALLGGFFSALFDRLLPHSYPHIIVTEKKVRSEINKWVTKLAIIQTALDDAEEKQWTNMAAKMWLDDLRDFAYDLEDLLDKHNTAILKRSLDAQSIGDAISKPVEELKTLWDNFNKMSSSRGMNQREDTNHINASRVEYLYVSVSQCRALKSLSSRVRLSVQHLEIQHCSSITTLGRLAETLERLETKTCRQLDSLSSGQLPASLKYLSIYDCPIRNLSSTGQLPASLQHLDIKSCPLLTSLSSGVQNLPSQIDSLRGWFYKRMWQDSVQTLFCRPAVLAKNGSVGSGDSKK